MALRATRPTVSARASVSRQRTTVVRCSAQQPSMGRKLMAAGAALLVLGGASVSPADAFPLEETLKGYIKNPNGQANGILSGNTPGAPDTKTVLKDERANLPPGNAAASGTGSDLVQVKTGAPPPADAAKNPLKEAGKN